MSTSHDGTPRHAMGECVPPKAACENVRKQAFQNEYGVQRMTDVTKQIQWALLDVKTKKLNKKINDARNKSKPIWIQITGYLDDQDWGGYDGVSIEQGLSITSAEMVIEDAP